MATGTAADAGTGDAVSVELAAMLARLGELAAASDTLDASVSDATRIDRIALLERLRGAVAGAQQGEMVAFGRSQVAEHIRDVAVDPRKVGRGIGDQIALACRISPHAGSRRLGVARALHSDLPRVRGLLRAGQISEDLVERVVSETSHLDPADRRAVDVRLAGADLPALSSKTAAATARRCAYEADPVGYTARGRTARKDRRVTVRPAPDTMSVLSGLLPVEQGVACLAALRAEADTLIAAGDPRSRDQIQADTLVERITGQARARDVNVEVNLVVPVDALLDPDSDPDPEGPREDTGSVELVGYGPLPLGIARDLLAHTAGRRWWRRLFTRPAAVSGESVLLGGDPRRRRFDGFLATLIGLRDGGRCRDPYCDAAIRHTDHITRSRAGGPTSYSNGRGVCARGNYVREMPGWRVETLHDGLDERPHTVRTTTPTGHQYDSRAGP